MKYKKVIVGISGVLLIGAGAYMYLQYGQGINMPNLGTLIETGQALSDKQETGDMETEEQVESGVVEDEELVELSESELHEIFEEVYLDSVRELRTYLEISKSQLLNSEYDRIELACPMGKTLPTDYRDQYKVWREEYKLSDMSYIFTTGIFELYYVKESSYAYTNIYKEAKMTSFPTNEAVIVVGIGYDKGEGWIQICSGVGTVYIEADKVVKAGTSFSEVSKTMYAIEAVNIKVEPKDSAGKADSLEVGESVHVIGIGELDVVGWYKIEIDGQEYYVRSEYLSAEKPVTNAGGNTSGSNTSGSNSSGGSQNNGGNTGNTSNGSGGSETGGGTGNPYLDTSTPELTEEERKEIERIIEEAKEKYGDCIRGG